MMQEILEQLLQQYRRFKRCVFAMILLLVVAVVFVFINRTVTFVILAAAVLYHIFYLRKLQKRYVNTFTDTNIRETLGKDIGAVDVDSGSGGKITEGTVRQAQMVPFDERAGSCLLREGLDGEMDGLKVALCDAVLAETFQLVKKGKNRIHYLTGVWITYTLNQDTGADWRLLDKDVLPVPIRQNYYKERKSLKRMHFDNAADERFILYSRNETVPDNKLMREILALADYTPGKLAVSLKGDKLTIFIRDRILARGISVKNPPTMETLTFHPFPEIRYTTQCAKRCNKMKVE